MSSREPAARPRVSARPPSDGDRPIDAHVHVWTDDTDAYPFGPHDGLAAPSRTYAADSLVQAMNQAEVAQALAIQPRVYGYDHAHLLSVGTELKERIRVMPLINVARPSACSELESLATHPAVAGFRVIVRTPRLATALLAEPATQVWTRLAELRLPVGFLIDPPLLPVVKDIAAYRPDLRIVVDHLACIDAKSWQGQGPALLRLSRRRNVYVKMSALGHLSDLPSPYTDLHEAVIQLLESYGAARLLWGSDWPHVYGNGTYEDSSRAVVTALNGASDHELNLILAGTARSLFAFQQGTPIT